MSTETVPITITSLNIADRLTEMATRMPDAPAVIEPGRHRWMNRHFRQFTFGQLNLDSDRIARRLVSLGADRRSRLVLMVRPGFDFISLVFAIFKTGAIAVLIDPGMGLRGVLRCLDDVRPDGFIAIPPVHAVRVLTGTRYRQAQINLTVGRRWFWRAPTLESLRRSIATNESSLALPAAAADDPAAIIFTSGSTGPAKGVLYTHGNFDAQVDQIRQRYDIRPGAVDLACFPLFGLFNCAWGVTTVIPDMNASRPATVDPAKIVEAIGEWRITQSFASPAVWNRVGEYCEAKHLGLPSLRQVFSAGAPVSPEILTRMRACLSPACELHTPYGATESLPVATIDARTVLDETRQATDRGAGTCVGHRFRGIEWKVIRNVDGPIASIAEIEELPTGEIGELIVRGPQVTQRYVTQVKANALTKIADGDGFWHRIGDVGYFDAQQRFWFCGRMSQRVTTTTGPMFTEPCECIVRTHPSVFRAALVGIGPRGQQIPIMVVEPRSANWPLSELDKRRLLGELRATAAANPLTSPIQHFLLYRNFPVDSRHNSKIVREELAAWAAGQIGTQGAAK